MTDSSDSYIIDKNSKKYKNNYMKDWLIDKKIHCDCCKVDFAYMAYRKHLKSKIHQRFSKIYIDLNK